MSAPKVIAVSIVAAVLCSVLALLVLKPFKEQPQPTQEIAAQSPQAEKDKAADQEDLAKEDLGMGVNVALAMKERTLGAEDAPVTIIEYASLSCGHCAMFHNNVMPEIKKQLIETGEAKLVYRDMPWDKFAVKAAQLTRCAPHEKYFDFLAEVFSKQGSWTQSEDPEKALHDLGVAAGMDESHVTACLGSEPLAKAVLEKMQEARRDFNIVSTPSFIFMKDGAAMESYPAFDKIAKEAAEKHPHSH